MQHILAATDFSTRSDRAIRRATLLAREHGAALTLVHVIDDDQPQSKLDAERREVEPLLAALMDAARADGVASNARIDLGDAFAGILRVRDQVSADLIVLGAHRRQILRDAFVGTTAERVIKLTSVPVLMANVAPVGVYRRILVATDLSDASASASLRLSSLGLLSRSPYDVVHAFQAPAVSVMSHGLVGEDAITEYVLEEARTAKAALDAFTRRAGLSSATSIIATPVRTRTVDALLQVAKHEASELIVIGPREKPRLARLLIGSTAEEILSRAEMDVLVAP